MQIKTKIGIETKVMKEYRIKVRKIIILANELFLLVFSNDKSYII